MGSLSSGVISVVWCRGRAGGSRQTKATASRTISLGDVDESTMSGLRSGDVGFGHSGDDPEPVAGSQAQPANKLGAVRAGHLDRIDGRPLLQAKLAEPSPDGAVSDDLDNNRVALGDLVDYAFSNRRLASCWRPLR